MRVDGINVTFKVDSGADVTVISDNNLTDSEELNW